MELNNTKQSQASVNISGNSALTQQFRHIKLLLFNEIMSVCTGMCEYVSKCVQLCVNVCIYSCCSVVHFCTFHTKRRFEKPSSCFQKQQSYRGIRSAWCMDSFRLRLPISKRFSEGHGDQSNCQPVFFFFYLCAILGFTLKVGHLDLKRQS